VAVSSNAGDLAGRVAIVTGANHGIGEATVGRSPSKPTSPA